MRVHVRMHVRVADGQSRDAPGVVALPDGRPLLVAERQEVEQLADAQQRVDVVVEGSVRDSCNTQEPPLPLQVCLLRPQVGFRNYPNTRDTRM